MRRSQGEGNHPLNEFKDMVDAEHTRVVAPDYATAVRILQERFGSDWTVVHSRKVRRSGLLGWLGLSDVVVIVRTQKSSNDILTSPVQLQSIVEEKIPVLAGDITGDEDSSGFSMESPERSEPRFSTPSSVQEISASLGSGQNREFESGSHPGSGSLNAPKGDSDLPVTGVSGFNTGSPLKDEPEPMTGVPESLSELSARLECSRQRIAEELKAFNTSSPFLRVPDTWQSDAGTHPNVPPTMGVSEVLEDVSGAKDVYEDPVFLGKVTTILEKCGFSPEARTEIMSAVSGVGVPGDLDEAGMNSLIESRIGNCIMSRIPQAGGISLANTAGKAKFVALVGPTGVGKTTTLAKLAAYFHVVEKKKVGLITLDSYRLGAIEQLRRFADIIGLSFKTVNEPEKIQEEIASFKDYDVVFVDTAGRSQKDIDRLKEVRDCLTNVDDLEVHLCLSLGAAPEALLATADAFRIVGYDRVIFTKRDESYSKGFLWDLFGVMQMPVSYITCGQEVPEDFDTASREKIRDMILGVE